jgi:hypothetical protein
MKTSRKDAVIKKLWKAVLLMDEARISITKLNENGKQFDYVSDPKLSDVTDRINKEANIIDWIVYQKNK